MKLLFTLMLLLACQALTAQEEEPSATGDAPSKHVVLTLGYMHAGGSLAGADLEILVKPRMGIQAGLGYLGYEAGFNFHFRPVVNSSFIAFKYWHQGLNSRFRQDAIGATFNFRAGKLIATQLGLAVPMNTGPAMPPEYEVPDVMLLYSIGIYLPLF